VSATASAAAPQPSPAQSVETAKLEKLRFERGQWVGELSRAPPLRVLVTLSTKEQPLLPRARAAHFRIAELLSPGLVAPTALRAVTVEELGLAADDPARKRLASHARVLANGSVEVALTLAPAPTLVQVELTRLVEESIAHSWESSLGGRDPVPPARAAELAQYQSLLAVDYVAGNAARARVYRHERSGRITAADGNEAFSPSPTEGALTDALARLSRHMTYSKVLAERLERFERGQVEKALTWGAPPTLLSTPKQVEEAVDRARSVRRLVLERAKQRGEDKALTLP
jgi:hypothetical protein